MRYAMVPMLLALTATPVLAQGMRSGTSLVGASRAIYAQTRDYLKRTAAKVPDDLYSFRPTPEVRSLGEILGHVANSNFLFCSAAKGEKNPNAANFEKTPTKAALTKALNDAFAYCDGAYQMSDAKAGEKVQIPFFGEQTRMFALTLNGAHDYEHYGNLVTYMRLKGIVPPSSERSGGD